MPDERKSILRVMHVVSGDLWAGAEAMAHTLLLTQHRDPSLEVQAVILNPGELADKISEHNIPVTILDESRLSSIRILLALRKLIENTRPDIVHTHRKKENVLGSLAARMSKTKSIRTVHGWTEFPTQNLQPHKRALRWLDQYCGRQWQQAVVAVSAELASKIETDFGTERVHIIENGVALDSTRALAATNEQSLPGLPDSQRIAIVARLVPVKRHDRFLAVAKLMLEHAENTNLDFYIVGDGPLAALLADRAHTLGISSRVHFLGFRDDVLSIVSQMDAIVVCSDHEGIPMNVLEAAALQIQVVTVPLPSIETILNSGANGKCADASDPGAIARTLTSVLNAPTHPVTPLDHNWNFSSETMSARYRQLYDNVLTDADR